MPCSNDLTIVSKRIAAEMVKISQVAHKDTRVNQRFMELFMGFGGALAICWEVAHGRPKGYANKMKPIDVLKWAQNLPDVAGDIVVMPRPD